MDSKNKGIILSVVGGLSGFGLAFLVPLMFLELYINSITYELQNFVQILKIVVLVLQLMFIIGGIITIIGALIGIASEKIGWIIVLVGAIGGGGLVIAIIGAIILKPTKSKSNLTNQNIPVYTPPQNSGQKTEE
ncbi:MAG: hypothetical protein ACFFBP_03035 [Promethearchaeota archaeon]